MMEQEVTLKKKMHELQTQMNKLQGARQPQGLKQQQPSLMNCMVYQQRQPIRGAPTGQQFDLTGVRQRAGPSWCGMNSDSLGSSDTPIPGCTPVPKAPPAGVFDRPPVQPEVVTERTGWRCLAGNREAKIVRFSRTEELRVEKTRLYKDKISERNEQEKHERLARTVTGQRCSRESQTDEPTPDQSDPSSSDTQNRGRSYKTAPNRRVAISRASTTLREEIRTPENRLRIAHAMMETEARGLSRKGIAKGYAHVPF